MSEAKDKTIALNVRLKPSESSAHPRATNYTNVGVAQGIAYVDFGCIEPTLLAAIAKTAKDGWRDRRMAALQNMLTGEKKQELITTGDRP